jgi:hypothetical protein
MSSCTSSLQHLLSIIQLPTLRNLLLNDCSGSLKQLPDTIGQLTSLTDSSLVLRSCTSLQQLPDSIGQLTALTSLFLSHCSSLRAVAGQHYAADCPRQP